MPRKSSKTTEILTQVRIFAACTMAATKVKAFCFVLVYFRVLWLYSPEFHSRVSGKHLLWPGDKWLLWLIWHRGTWECEGRLLCGSGPWFEFRQHSAWCTLFSWKTSKLCNCLLFFTLWPRKQSEKTCICIYACILKSWLMQIYMHVRYWWLHCVCVCVRKRNVQSVQLFVDFHSVTLKREWENVYLHLCTDLDIHIALVALCMCVFEWERGKEREEESE